MREVEFLEGTFTNGDLVAGVLTLTYIPDVATPLECVVTWPGDSNYTMRYNVLKIDDNSCEVNIGEQLKTGTYKWELTYAND